MSNEKPGNQMGPGEYEGLRRKLVADAMTKFKFTKEQTTELDRLLIRAKDVDLVVKRHLRPVLQAGGWRDKEALRGMAASLYLESFDSFSKEDLQNICAMIYLEMFMEFVDANPWANDKPDLLGG